MEEKKISVDGIEYEVILQRFDEDIDPGLGAVYHGFHIRIPQLDVLARKYDDEGYVRVLDAPTERESETLATVAAIAEQLFGMAVVRRSEA